MTRARTEFNYSLISREEALNRLGLGEFDDDLIRDALEEKLFPLRDYFLRNPIIVPLYRTRIRKLLQLYEVEKVLFSGDGDKPSGKIMVEIDHGIFESRLDLAELIRSRESHIAQMRQEMAADLTAAILIEKAEELCQIEEQYMRRFLELSREYTSANEDIKAAESIDAGEFLFLWEQSDEDVHRHIAREKKRIETILGRQKQKR